MEKDKHEKSKYALVLIDFISDYEFEDGDQLFKLALPAAQKSAALKKHAKKAGIPVIYVNDNFGKWQEDFKSMIKEIRQKSGRGKQIVEILQPENDDYYVLKPRHSAFYKTVFELLLQNLEAETLILTGVAADICVLFTANDAYMREFKIIIPEDCVAAVTNENTAFALRFMEKNLKAEITDAEKLAKKLSKIKPERTAAKN